MKVLVAEASWTTAAVSSELIAQRIGVMRANDGEELLHLAELGHLNAVVVDCRMQGVPLLSAVRRLRHLDRNTGILAVARLETPREVARTLDLGADDVVAHATDPAEVVARLRAVVRRRAGAATPRIAVGDLLLDIEAQTVAVNGEEMRLTRLEYQLVEFLALGANVVRGKEAILTHLYFHDDEPHSRVVDVYVCRIRREILRLGGDPTLLETVWGRGYVLRDAHPVPSAA
jgi:two-component system cell cycle response regulator CtrA